MASRVFTFPLHLYLHRHCALLLSCREQLIKSGVQGPNEENEDSNCNAYGEEGMY